MNNTKTTHLKQPNSGEPIFFDLDEFDSLTLPAPEYVLWGLARGAVGMLQSVTNVGKTTLMLNLGLSLASGQAWGPIVAAGEPRRVMYIDMETPIEELRADIQTMRRALPEEAAAKVGPNFKVYPFMYADGEDLRLSDPTAFARILQKVIDFKPDLIVIDTLSLAFVGVDENSNTEISDKIMKPLGQLARRGNSAVVVCHHIGKEKSEEGRASLGVMRSRGGSSLPSACRIVYQLDRRISNGDEQVWFSIEKMKGAPPAAFQVDLDLDSRWFVPTGSADDGDPQIEQLVEFVGDRVVTRAEIEAQFQMPSSSLGRLLKRANDQGRVVKVGHGLYQKSK